MPDLKQQKHELRQRMKTLRDAIPAADRTAQSQAVADHVLGLDAVQNARSVFVFVSFGSEIHTHGLIDALLERGKIVAVPKLLPDASPSRAGAKRMAAIPITSLDELAPGPMGILIPTNDIELNASPDITLVPGLAFCRESTGRVMRLGYGGGYYDRYLAAHPQTRTVGLCFAGQVTDAIPVGEHDLSIERVVAR